MAGLGEANADAVPSRPPVPLQREADDEDDPEEGLEAGQQLVREVNSDD